MDAVKNVALHVVGNAGAGYVGCYVFGVVAPPVGAGMMVAGGLARDILFGSDDTTKEKAGLSAYITYLSGMIAAGMFLLEKPLVTAAVIAMAGTAIKVVLASTVGGLLFGIITLPLAVIAYKLNLFPEKMQDLINRLEEWADNGFKGPVPKMA